MSSGSQAFSDIWEGTPDDTEYDGVYAAVMATERGRWFLTEYASRNRQTDTHAVLGALARLETAVRSSAAVQDAAKPVTAMAHTGSPDVAVLAERIQDIAFMLRDRAADADLCDALDAAARDIGALSAAGIGLPGSDRIDPAAAAAERISDEASSVSNAPPDTHDSAKVSDGAPAFADVQHSPEVEPAAAPQQSGQSAAIPIAALDPGEAEPAPAEASDGSPRWYIEPPDFAFQRLAAEQTEPQIYDAPAENGHGHALLPQAQLLSGPGPQDDPADLFESPDDAFGSAAIASTPAIITPAAIAPPLMLPPLRAAQSDPLAGLRALSEEEVIALFS